MNWQIELYEKPDHTCPVLEFILGLPPKHRAKLEREIDLLAEHGVNLTYPHVRAIAGHRYQGLWELRVRSGNDISRVFYFARKDRTFVLLHGFVKKSQKTPSRELETAYRYMLDYQRRCAER